MPKEVRETIELLCSILSENGVAHVKAETLRKAKFDHPDVCLPLWKLLFELVVFCQYGFDRGLVCKFSANVSPERQVAHVKQQLQIRGYLCRHLASLPVSMASGSQELLLVFAWLLRKEDIIHQFLEINCLPVDYEHCIRFEHDESGDVLEAPWFGNGEYSVAEHVQQMLLLNTKLRMNLRLLHSAQQECSTLTHRINRATYGLSLNAGVNHLTVLQVHMLKDASVMEKMLSLLEKENCRLEKFLKWEEKEHIFWDWMESVLILKQQRLDWSVNGSTTDPCCMNASHPVVTDKDAIFLDVPRTITADIHAARKDLMKCILRHESAIERLEDLWATKRCLVSGGRLDEMMADIDKEICQIKSSIHTAIRKPYARTLCHHAQMVLVKSKGSNCEENNENVKSFSPGISNRCNLEVKSRPISDEILQIRNKVVSLENDLVKMRCTAYQRLNKNAHSLPDKVCVLPQ